MTQHDYLFLIVGAIIALFLFWFVRNTKKSNYRMGRQAYLDGLRYNPAWGEDVCRGYRDARVEDLDRNNG